MLSSSEINPIIENSELNQPSTRAERSPKVISLPLFNDVNASVSALTPPLQLPTIPNSNNVFGKYLPWNQNDFDDDLDHYIIANETENLKVDNSNLSKYLENLLDNPKNYSNSFWDFIHKWKDETSLDINQLNLQRFLDCYSPNSSGTIAIMENGEHIPVRMVCNETMCLLCDNRKRRRLAYQKVEELKPLFQTGKLPGISFVVLTLPEEIEDRDDIIKDITNRAHNMFREFYGLDKRSNIYLRIAIHPVGHSDLFRTRYHLHVAIIPAEINQSGNIKTVEFPHDHLNANTNILRKLWGECLKPYLKIELPVVRYEYLKYTESDDFFSKLGHRYIYDYRSFSHDVELSVLKTNLDTGQVILKAQKSWLYFWRIVDMPDLVQRYKYIRKNNKIIQRGWGMRLKKIFESLNIIKEEKDEKPIFLIKADVDIIRKKTYSPVLKKVVRHDIEIWTYRNPLTGKLIQKDKRQIIKENLIIKGKQKQENDILLKNYLDFVSFIT